MKISNKNKVTSMFDKMCGRGSNCLKMKTKKGKK